MAKKRPRIRTGKKQTPGPVSKLEPSYWRGRLFRNTFTYKGRRHTVNGWSVKIQHSGRRKTFSLAAGDCARAALEACQLFQTIRTYGWQAVEPRVASDPASADSTATPFEWPPEYWQRRLQKRRYPERADGQAPSELSVRIEHAGQGHYFPLQTSRETEATSRARDIYETVARQGWFAANQKFTRELTLALRWTDDPVAWTYTTLHTRPGVLNWRWPNAGNRTPEVIAAVIEPDAALRIALAECLTLQAGFRCEAAFAGGEEASREIPRRKVHLVLANHDLPHEPGSAWLERLQQLCPSLGGVLYSVFEDSEHLFKATPGGAVGYILKRTPPFRIFEPIAGSTPPFTREHIAARVREYFQRLFASLPPGAPVLQMAKLTPREHEILALLAKGDLAKEIAESLGISIWTVHGHVKSILEKLNVHTRTEAVVKFLQK